MTNDLAQKPEVLRELSDADRAYRAAFGKLTSRGGLQPATSECFEELLAAAARLLAAVRLVCESDPQKGQ